MNMKQHGSRLGITALSMALALGLGGIAFAQGNTNAGATPPANMQPATPTGHSATSMPSTTTEGMTTNGQQSSDTGAATLSPSTIKQAQQQLKSEGLYNGAVDGHFGPETQAAVKQFQQKNNLKVTASLDQETLQRLMSMQSHG